MCAENDDLGQHRYKHRIQCTPGHSVDMVCACTCIIVHIVDMNKKDGCRDIRQYKSCKQAVKSVTVRAATYAKHPKLQLRVVQAGINC